MNSHSLNCPHCRAVLKSKQPVPPGVKVKCPKCQQPFVSPPPEEDELVEPEFEESTAVQSAQTMKQTAVDRNTNVDSEPRKSRNREDDDVDEVEDIDDVEDVEDLDELDELDE